MLVLTRKRQEIVRIGDNIVIEVLEIGPGRVKLGISAPNNVTVLRGEVVPVAHSIEDFREQQAVLNRRENCEPVKVPA